MSRLSTRMRSLRPGGERARWMLVVTFAAGMAWVEAACVYYLRVMVDRVVPYQPDPLPIRGILGEVELVREGATLLMLAMIGMLAGRTWRARLGYAAIAFGFWDILYYVFLRIVSGWPASLFDWDILFLLPLPWWGPVLAPVCIAALMIAWGTLVTQWPRPHPGDSFHAGLVGRELGRHPARAGGVHGRFDSCPARRARRGPSGAADDVQLAGVRRGAPAHGHAVGAESCPPAVRRS